MGIALPQNGRVYLDANVIVCSIERVPEYWGRVASIWSDSLVNNTRLLTSELTITEVLTRPLRLNDNPLKDNYEELFASGYLALMPVTSSILRKSAEIRASANLKTPDAIHVATAILHHANLFITNDKTFKRINNLNVVLLSDL